jgi:4-hydroxy-2-oxoheptanedioate aldolase
MRASDGTPPSPEEFQQALKDILHGCKRLGIAAGLHTFSLEDAKMRIAEGWQLVAVGSELKFMADGAAKIVEGLGMISSELAKY